MVAMGGGLFLMSEVSLYAYKKLSPPRTLQSAYAQGPTLVLGGGGVDSYE